MSRIRCDCGLEHDEYDDYTSDEDVSTDDEYYDFDYDDEDEIPKCAQCMKTADQTKDLVLRICTHCKTAHYCTRKCQKTHWIHHKEFCDSVWKMAQLLSGPGTNYPVELQDDLEENLARFKYECKSWPVFKTVPGEPPCPKPPNTAKTLYMRSMGDKPPSPRPRPTATAAAPATTTKATTPAKPTTPAKATSTTAAKVTTPSAKAPTPAAKAATPAPVAKVVAVKATTPAPVKPVTPVKTTTVPKATPGSPAKATPVIPVSPAKPAIPATPTPAPKFANVSFMDAPAAKATPTTKFTPVFKTTTLSSNNDIKLSKPTIKPFTLPALRSDPAGTPISTNSTKSPFFSKEPGQQVISHGLIKHIENPYRCLSDKTWLHNRPEEDVYKLLIDCFRMRQHDNFTVEGLKDKDSLYGGASNSQAGFKRFLVLAESRTDLLPGWWFMGKAAANCLRLGGGLGATPNEWSSLARKVDKAAIIDHYSNPEMPMQLRMLGEQIYLRGPGGQSGVAMLEFKMEAESMNMYDMTVDMSRLGRKR
ncbi:hypothetical protein BGX23_009152 [Mortierella sp. AD031]|nr:hypothetical protein BGX23_009152 [Mortierella sp. AD031]